MNFLIVEGTVREGRQSIKAAKKAEELFNRNHEAELFDPKGKDIPFLGPRRYKEDEEGTPEPIEEFGEKVEEADALIIVSPEYNSSIPGALKNLIDYLYPEYEDKLFSYITVSAGGFGGIRSLSHLQDITLTLNARPGPSLQVSKVHEKFQGDELVDEELERRFKEFVDNVIEAA